MKSSAKKETVKQSGKKCAARNKREFPYREQHTAQHERKLLHCEQCTTQRERELPYCEQCTVQLERELPYREHCAVQCEHEIPHCKQCTVQLERAKPRGIQRRTATKSLVLMSLFVALTSVFSQIAFPLPFTPVPVSFGLVGVYLTGLMLRPRQAVFSQLCYILLGAVGAPVFSQFNSGVGALIGPTGGYLMAYPVISCIISAGLNRVRKRKKASANRKGFLFIRACAVLLLAQAVLYLVGTIWFCAITGQSFAAALSLTVLPFLLPDTFKIAAITAAAPSLLRIAPHRQSAAVTHR